MTEAQAAELIQKVAELKEVMGYVFAVLAWQLGSFLWCVVRDALRSRHVV